MMKNDDSEVFLLDTNIASIAWDKGHSSYSLVKSNLDKLDQNYVWISCVTIAEVEFGLQSARDINFEKQKIVRDNMYSYKSFWIDDETARHYADIRSILCQKYHRLSKSSKYIEDLVDDVTAKILGIQENDLWIVSIARQYNLVFITGDKAGGMKRVVEAASYQHRTQYWLLS